MSHLTPVTPRIHLRHDFPEFHDTGSPRRLRPFFNRPRRLPGLADGFPRVAVVSRLALLDPERRPSRRANSLPVGFDLDGGALGSRHDEHSGRKGRDRDSDSRLELPLPDSRLREKRRGSEGRLRRPTCRFEPGGSEHLAWTQPLLRQSRPSITRSYADTDGPFDSILDGNHSFLNLAMVLFYLPQDRDRAMQVEISDSRRLETRDLAGRRRQ